MTNITMFPDLSASVLPLTQTRCDGHFIVSLIGQAHSCLTVCRFCFLILKQSSSVVPREKPSPPQIFVPTAPFQWWLSQASYLELQPLSSSWLSSFLFPASFLPTKFINITHTIDFALSLPLETCSLMGKDLLICLLHYCILRLAGTQWMFN